VRIVCPLMIIRWPSVSTLPFGVSKAQLAPEKDSSGSGVIFMLAELVLPHANAGAIDSSAPILLKVLMVSSPGFT